LDELYLRKASCCCQLRTQRCLLRFSLFYSLSWHLCFFQKKNKRPSQHSQAFCLVLFSGKNSVLGKTPRRTFKKHRFVEAGCCGFLYFGQAENQLFPTFGCLQVRVSASCVKSGYQAFRYLVSLRVEYASNLS
jgi:hypothetical protein